MQETTAGRTVHLMKTFAVGAALAIALIAHAQAGLLDPLKASQGAAQSSLSAAFSKEVDRRLEVPREAQEDYGQRLEKALSEAGHPDVSGEYVILVDRNALVQALFLYWRGSPRAKWQLVGASQVSTGMPGSFEHFITPVGVFLHTPDNMDYRAEGTRNENGIRGYGNKGMRVYDFGWQQATRGWGSHARSTMRLQMHATDPDRLEILLGMPHSKGCIRIAATLNTFIDRHGVIDAEYVTREKEKEKEAQSQAQDQAQRSTQAQASTPGHPSLPAQQQTMQPEQAPKQSLKPPSKPAQTPPPKLAILEGKPDPVAGAGRYLVIIDSGARSRPAWSPDPQRHGDKYKDAAANDTAD